MVGKSDVMNMVANGWLSVCRAYMRAGLRIRSWIGHVPGGCRKDLRIIQVHRGRVGVVVSTGVVGRMMLGLAMKTVSNLKAYKRILVCSIYLQ